MKRIVMIKGIVLGCLAIAFSFSGGLLFADVQRSTDNNTDIDIDDGSLVGVPLSASTITITENEIIEDVTFSIEGLSHGFAGDLVAIVRHVESNKTATLFSRIGKTSPTTGVGDESDFGGDYDFSDATMNNIWSEAALGSTGYVLRNKADASQPNPGIYRAAAGISGAPISLKNAFEGGTTQGTWVLELTDRNFSEEGSFREFKVNFTSTAVPEPSTIVLMLAAGIGAIGIRRRRR